MLRSPPAIIEAGSAASLRRAVRRRLPAALGIALAVGAALPAARADSLSRGAAALDHGNHLRAVRELSPLAARGNPRALGLLGFMYEHGFGVPQAYDAAFDLYCQGATRGDPFAQAMLGLMYDKGHGAHQDFIQAYKWLDLAVARSQGHARDIYTRLRNAVASKMSRDEIIVGQRLALSWLPGAPAYP
ncbi:sel1 repeat family protein [Bradyrhizobium sp. ISRA464]|nr:MULTISPECIES: tetratricopeptide repeat protein [unclassified Bradyrhizobium]WGS18105.1 sel1 repeat family protein [Bradyrhizobium sp. ISRA463]WGS24919.1 sel1 repeat family protein [Bradyrhizobium sp. ISRA464]